MGLPQQAVLHPTPKTHICSQRAAAQSRRGGAENLLRRVFPALSSDAIILQPHKPLATCRTFTPAAVPEVRLLPLFVPCQPGELLLQDSVKMLPPGEKLHQLPWALTLLFFGPL